MPTEVSPHPKPHQVPASPPNIEEFLELEYMLKLPPTPTPPGARKDLCNGGGGRITPSAIRVVRRYCPL